MDAAAAIPALSALAHEHRLAIYRLLVEHGSAGLPAGVIAENVGIAPSSLTFHLQHLTRAGLLSQRRESRQIIYAADFAAMNTLVSYLTENCCAVSGESCAPAPCRSARRSSGTSQRAKPRHREAARIGARRR